MNIAPIIVAGHATRCTVRGRRACRTRREKWDNGGVRVAAMRFDLHVPASRSLKAKRQAIRPITDGLRQRFKVSVAEVGCHDQWQRAVIGVAAVAPTSGRLEEMLAACERFVYSAADVEVLAVETTHLDTES